MKRVKTLLILVFLLSLTSCGKEDVVAAEPATKDVKEVVQADVNVDDIAQPVVGEFLCTLQAGEQKCDVYYGTGYMNYLIIDSGLPGFGYPMCIVCEQISADEVATIEMTYGTYVYTYRDSREGFAVSDINFGVKQEQLYVYSAMDEMWYCYDLEDGPVIGG